MGMSHFHATGFLVSDDLDAAQAMLARAEEAALRAGDVVEHGDGRTLRYVDPSGATLSVHVGHDGSLLCAHPGFDGGSRFRWRPAEVIPSPDGCRFCDLVHAEMLGDAADGVARREMYYPIALTVETIGQVRDRLPYGEPGFFTFAALAEDVELWESEEAFLAGQAAHEAKLAPESLIPLGLFPAAAEEDHVATSRVLANGIVRSATRRQNELGGGIFFHLRLETYGGTFDVCVGRSALQHDARPGTVLGGTFWLVGRPLLDAGGAGSRRGGDAALTR